MKTFLQSLIVTSLLLAAMNANALRQEPDKETGIRTMQRSDGSVMRTMQLPDGSIIQLMDMTSSKTPYFKVDSDVDYRSPDSLGFDFGGDLYRLTQNIYASFLAYQDGSTSVPKARRYARVIGDEDDIDNVRVYYTDSLKIIPKEAVKSIEVVSNPFQMFSTTSHPDGTCVIRVGLKDRDLYERVTYIPTE